MNSLFIGQNINGYIIVDYINEGKIGKVFRAHRKDIDDTRAIKFILKENLRDGWENEITKVVKIKNIPSVVNYYEHGFITLNGKEYLYISWDYIKSDSLKDLILKNLVSMPIIVDVFEIVLEVLHACGQSGIVHADLHSGNILIESQNKLLINSERRRVYITDFGYALADGRVDILDDFKGLLVILKDCLATLDFHKLDGKGKYFFRLFKDEIPKILTETNVIEGPWVRNPKGIAEKWTQLKYPSSQNESVIRNIGDYLAAEHIGRNYNEWGELFVPKILAVNELLSKNICVLTGLRGCGKTMIYRRLTAIFDEHLGPSKVEGADSFIGFYLNARNIAEAFPWLPDKYEADATSQVINYFHLSWCLEILEWLKIVVKKDNIDLAWLTSFFCNYYPQKIYTSDNGNNILFHLSSFFSQELERSRLRSNYGEKSNWELSSLKFLEEFSDEIIKNCGIGNKSIFFFLDDYSTPLVTSCTQRILNPIVFRRTSSLFFKVATESTESFEPIGLNGKVLEEEDDYKLIDFGTYAYSLDNDEIKELLSLILKKRIERHDVLAKDNHNLESLLGPTDINNTGLAHLIREGEFTKNGRVIKKDKYVGIDVFCSMWSSDIRESISLFAEMISNLNFEKIDLKGDRIIDVDIQDRAYRDAGGKFLSLLETATNPSVEYLEVASAQHSFGNHLVEIAKAFQEISHYCIIHKDSKNLNSNPPKQARRIEITSVDNNLTGDLYDYYRGILRYGVFIRDYKGKSVRGKVVPRLYLRGLLIPSFRISFSKRDSITMNWDEFCSFLSDPRTFKKAYIEKLNRGKKNDDDTQMKLKMP